MSANRDLWREWVPSLPHWPCRTCGQGSLRPVRGYPVEEPTSATRKALNDEAWDPTWDRGRFIALLRCDNARCGDVATVHGETGVDPSEHPEDGPQFITLYRTLSVHPSPMPIRIPPETPVEVASALRDAAALLWPDAEAAANKVRQAVERFLTVEGVTGTETTKAGKAQRLHLHGRIEVYGKQPDRAEAAEALLAAKWIGNAGSHSPEDASGMRRDDVLDAMEMMEQVLEDRYVGTRAKLRRKIADVNERKGIVGTRR